MSHASYQPCIISETNWGKLYCPSHSGKSITGPRSAYASLSLLCFDPLCATAPLSNVSERLAAAGLYPGRVHPSYAVFVPSHLSILCRLPPLFTAWMFCTKNWGSGDIAIRSTFRKGSHFHDGHLATVGLTGHGGSWSKEPQSFTPRYVCSIEPDPIATIKNSTVLFAFPAYSLRARIEMRQSVMRGEKPYFWTRHGQKHYEVTSEESFHVVLRIFHVLSTIFFCSQYVTTVTFSSATEKWFAEDPRYKTHVSDDA